MHQLKNFLIVLSVASFPSSVQALSVATTVEQDVTRTPLIVRGKIEKIRYAKPSEYSYDIAYVRVVRVFKSRMNNSNIKSGALIPVLMPSISNKYSLCGDVYYKLGAEKVWMLSYETGKGAYSYRSGAYPVEREQEVINALKAP